jgi:hypothetical protein
MRRDFPLRLLRVLVVLVIVGVVYGGSGLPAEAAPGESPATRIARLRAKATRVQAAIDRMNARIEVLVEDYNEVRWPPRPSASDACRPAWAPIASGSSPASRPSAATSSA